MTPQRTSRGGRKAHDQAKAAAAGEAYPTRKDQVTTLANTYHSHLVARDQAAAKRTLELLVEMAG